MTPYQIQKLLKLRKAAEDELNQMAQDADFSAAVKKAREGKGKKNLQYKAAFSAIRYIEGLDQWLYQVARIKKLPKPSYPGGERV